MAESVKRVGIGVEGLGDIGIDQDDFTVWRQLAGWMVPKLKSAYMGRSAASDVAIPLRSPFHPYGTVAATAVGKTPVGELGGIGYRGNSSGQNAGSPNFGKSAHEPVSPRPLSPQADWARPRIGTPVAAGGRERSFLP